MRVVAVEQGADATRLVVPRPDGGPEPVAVLPSGTTVAAALDDLVGPVRGTVALVHPPAVDGGVDSDAGSDIGGQAGSEVGGQAGGSVRVVPAPVAVLAGRSGRFLVVDAGRSGTTLTVVDDGCVRSTVRVPVGGDRLDARLADATGCPADRVRRVREALSFVDRLDVPGLGSLEAAAVESVLRLRFDDVVAPVPSLAAGVEEVVVAGGLARTPLLAEMLDETVTVPVRVLPEPDLAAVRGALEMLSRGGLRRTGPRCASPMPAPADARAGRAWSADLDAGQSGHTSTAGRAADAPDADGGTATSADLGAASGRVRSPRLRNGRMLPAAAVLGVLLVGTGSVLGAAGGSPAPPSGALVQYGYSIALPAGWEHTGGDPRRRRTLLTRTASPDGVELISVERSPLGYDSAAEPDRAQAELAAVHGAAGALGPLRPDTVAGRPVTRYRQQAGPGAVVDWTVLFDGTDELAVGCRRPIRGPAPELERACAEVVGSVRALDQPE